MVLSPTPFSLLNKLSSTYQLSAGRNRVIESLSLGKNFNFLINTHKLHNTHAFKGATIFDLPALGCNRGPKSNKRVVPGKREQITSFPTGVNLKRRI